MCSSIEPYRSNQSRLASSARAALLSAGSEGVERTLRLLEPAFGSTHRRGTVAVVAVDATGTVVHSLRDVTPTERSALQRLAEDLVDTIGVDPSQDLHETEVGTAAPIFAPDGHVVGVVATLLASCTRVQLGALSDAAGTIETEIRLRLTSQLLVAQLAADQIESAVESSLSSVVATTQESWTTVDVARTIAAHGETAIGATLVSLATIDGDSLRFVHGDGVADEVAQNWQVSPLNAPIPMAACVRSREPIVLPDIDSFDEWPMFRDTVDSLGIEGFMALPIVDPRGVVLAALGVGWAEPLPDTDVPVTVARLVSLTMEALTRAGEHEVAQDHAGTLESIVLPDRLPVAAGLDIHGRYLPPLFGQRVGGDVFDAWVRDDGAVAVLVADVTGHNLQATRTAAALRHSIGMLSLEMREPKDILAAVNRYVQNSEAIKLATCCYCVVDIQSATITIANAGHPQPRVRTADGSVSRVGPFGELLLGFGDDPYSQEVVAFGPGDALVMFTDGLIESRHADLLLAERRLDRQLAGVGGMTASEISAFLLGSLGKQRDDDVVVVTVRRPDGGRVAVETLSLGWSETEAFLSEARREIRDWFNEHTSDLGARTIDDAVLVATELLTNARAAATPSTSVELQCSLNDGRPEIAVSNVGEEFSHRPTMPAEGTPRGRGLAIVAKLADLSVESAEGLITVRAVLRSPQS